MKCSWRIRISCKITYKVAEHPSRGRVKDRVVSKRLCLGTRSWKSVAPGGLNLLEWLMTSIVLGTQLHETFSVDTEYG